MHPLTPLPPELGRGPFALGDADRMGVARSRLRRSDLITPLRGVRRPKSWSAEPILEADHPWGRSARQILLQACDESARMPAGAAFSHVTAAVVHGFPMRTSRLDAGVLHVTTFSDASRRQRHGVKVHPLPRDERRVTVRGLAVTHPVDTWCALSASLTVDELVELGDHLVRRQNPDAGIEDLRRAVARYAGRRGAKKLREAVELVRAGTDSVRETRLRLLVVRAGLPEPEVNASVRDRFGEHIKLGDLVFPRERVLLEYDGEQHRTDSHQYHKDMRDLERATLAGWIVIRVRKHDRDEAAVLRRVREALALRSLR